MIHILAFLGLVAGFAGLLLFLVFLITEKYRSRVTVAGIAASVALMLGSVVISGIN